MIVLCIRCGRQTPVPQTIPVVREVECALCCGLPCFRCGAKATEWFDGIGARIKGTARAICSPCEYNDWRATAHALSAPQG